MFTYKIMNDEECKSARNQLMAPGIYDFVVFKSEYKPSKKGNPMIELTLKVYDHSGREHQVLDWLLSIDSMMWKTKHFCEAVGILKEYEEGKFNEKSCFNKSGKCSVVVQKGRPKGDGSNYNDRNAISDYLAKVKQPESNDDSFTDSDIPF